MVHKGPCRMVRCNPVGLGSSVDGARLPLGLMVTGSIFVRLTNGVVVSAHVAGIPWAGSGYRLEV